MSDRESADAMGSGDGGMCRAKIDVVLLVAPAGQILEMVARTGNLTAEDERHR